MILLQKHFLKLIEQAIDATYQEKLWWDVDGHGKATAIIDKLYKFTFCSKLNELYLIIEYLPTNQTFSGSAKYHQRFISICMKLLISIKWQYIKLESEYMAISSLAERN